MSIFEKKTVRKIHLDDTHSLKATIINTENTQGFTEYVIRVQRGPSFTSHWHVHRRYNDFYSLHQELQQSGVPLPLPPKKILGKFEREFITERQAGLQKYLDVVISNRYLSSCILFKRFIDPQNYGKCQDLGLTSLCIGLRGEPDLNVTKQLPQLGWRLRKEFYLIDHNTSKDAFILNWVPFGPDKYLDNKHISAVLKSLCTLQHVNIAQITRAGVWNDGAWILKPFRKSGTLLDSIYGVKNPLSSPGLKKYSNFELRKPLPILEVITIASQILQALAYLHHKGIPYGHLHLGNIFIDAGTVKLLEIENSLLGLPSYYREYLIKCRGVHSMHDVDVFCFGLVLYEMINGREFNEDDYDMCRNNPILKEVLEGILLHGKCGLPRITDLLNVEIFRLAPPSPHPYLKLSSLSKQHLILSAKGILERINEDYTKLHQQKREEKMYELINEESGGILLFYDAKRSKSICTDNSPRSETPPEGTASSLTPAASLSSLGAIVEETPKKQQIPEDLGRVQLLSAICQFNKGNLKKVTP